MAVSYVRTVSEFAREGLWASAFLMFRCSVLLRACTDQEQHGTLEDAKHSKAKDELQKKALVTLASAKQSKAKDERPEAS